MGSAETIALPAPLAQFQTSIELLRYGNPENPPRVQCDDAVRVDFEIADRG